jgi:hypothetical protein
VNSESKEPIFSASSNQSLDISKLSYLNFDTSEPGAYFEHCNSAYELWKKVWIETYHELGVQKKVTSEDFLNRRLCGLFLNEKAIGFLLHHNLNLNLTSALDSNYFQSYNDYLIGYQKTKNDFAFIVSFMTINSDWRKSRTNYSISELLLSFAVLEFNFTPTHRILGYFRNNRSINDVFYRHAGHFLCRDMAHNIEVDFGEIYKNESHLSELKDHAVLSLKLWKIFYNNNKETIDGPKNNFTSRKNESPRRDFSYARMG